MAFIGNTPQNQGFTPAIDYFNGNGVTVTFTLSRPVVSVAQMIVAIDNVIQNPSSAFTVSGNSITFTSAPLSGTNNIWVEYTSLITQYNAISQDPSVIGDITATGGYLATGDFGNTFTDGTIVDYVTGMSRITTGAGDGVTIYNGGPSARNALFGADASGVFTTGSGRNISAASVPTGSVIQVVSIVNSSAFTTSSNTLQLSPVTLSITPKFATSKILVQATCSLFVQQNGQGQVYVYMRASLARGSTQLIEGRINTNTGTTANADVGATIPLTYLDSPATTSSVTYNIYISSLATAFLAGINNNAPSTITLMEIAG
jgi:hypothetical protein